MRKLICTDFGAFLLLVIIAIPGVLHLSCILQCNVVPWRLPPPPGLTRQFFANSSAPLLDCYQYKQTRSTLPPMTRSQLITKLAARYRRLTASDIEVSVSVILTAMADRLAEAGRVEIRGFGTFTANYRPPRTGHNPLTGAPVSVPAKYAPHFKPGSELRDRVAAAAKRVKPTASESKKAQANV